ncbi:peptide/nickel transport system substrate-binding protein [Actinocorallia herbida]|uniref:Peptide/nickel transport system substrate-binding protein n=1 Tax=Actinocorallia herbida TaxID=58109 RepID=A0A3N1CWW8_9ACTN|nr:ABC transporter substrate-binding protein [Actinocorallia herbida]ROO85792.1 peptide/nickel transport system substrate-binding protein [Actinocorallia herbida]
MNLSRPASVLAVLLALTLSACASGEDTGGAAETSAPVKGGEVIYAVDTEPLSFDVHVSQQDITASILRNVFDSLVSLDAEGEFQPWLAESWEVSDDLKTYTFKLRKDVKFTDGTPFDAEAVKVNFDRIHDPKTKSQLAASLLGPYTGTEVVDASTAKVSFSAPFAPFLQAASTAYLGFYSPKTIKENGEHLSAGGTVGVSTGPFVFSSYTKGQSATFTRNEAYAWAPKGAANTGAPYLDKLTVRFLPEASVRVGALTSGQVHVAAAVPPADAAGVSGNAALALETRDYPGSNYNLYLNTSRPPFDDLKVRKALQQGIDIDTDVKNLHFGRFKRAWSPLSPVTPTYDKSLENTWPYDPEAAGRLLDEAGWTQRDAEGYRTKNGERLVVEWPALPAQYVREQRDILAQAFQADLKKIGVEVVREKLDVASHIAAVYGGKADATDYSWARFEPDVLWLLFNGASEPAKGGANTTFLKDAQLTEWTDKGRTTLDKAVRDDLYGKVQKRAVELALVIPLYTQSAVLGRSKSVGGLAFDANAWPQFQGVWRTGA